MNRTSILPVTSVHTLGLQLQKEGIRDDDIECLSTLAALCRTTRGMQSVVGNALGPLGIARLLLDLQYHPLLKIRSVILDLIISLVHSHVSNQRLVLSQTDQIAIGSYILLTIPKTILTRHESKLRQWHLVQGHTLPSGDPPGNNKIGPCTCFTCKGKLTDKTTWTRHHHDLSRWRHIKDTHLEGMSLPSFIHNTFQSKSIRELPLDEFMNRPLHKDSTPYVYWWPVGSTTTCLDPQTHVVAIKVHVRLVINLVPTNRSDRRRALQQVLKEYSSHPIDGYSTMTLLQHPIVHEFPFWSPFLTRRKRVTWSQLLEYDATRLEEEKDTSSNNLNPTKYDDDSSNLNDLDTSILLYETHTFLRVAPPPPQEEEHNIKQLLDEMCLAMDTAALSIISCKVKMFAETTLNALRIQCFPHQDSCASLHLPLCTAFSATFSHTHFISKSKHVDIMTLDENSLSKILPFCILCSSAPSMYKALSWASLVPQQIDVEVQVQHDVISSPKGIHGLPHDVEILLRKSISNTVLRDTDLLTIMQTALRRCTVRMAASMQSTTSTNQEEEEWSSASAIERISGRDKTRLCRDILASAIDRKPILKQHLLDTLQMVVQASGGEVHGTRSS